MHPIRKILVYVSQGQDKFAFGEALSDIGLPPTIFHLLTG